MKIKCNKYQISLALYLCFFAVFPLLPYLMVILLMCCYFGFFPNWISVQPLNNNNFPLTAMKLILICSFWSNLTVHLITFMVLFIVCFSHHFQSRNGKKKFWIFWMRWSSFCCVYTKQPNLFLTLLQEKKKKNIK